MNEGLQHALYTLELGKPPKGERTQTVTQAMREVMF